MWQKWKWKVHSSHGSNEDGKENPGIIELDRVNIYKRKLFTYIRRQNILRV